MIPPKASVPLILVTPKRNNAYFLVLSLPFWKESLLSLGNLPQSIILIEYSEQVRALSAVFQIPHTIAAVLLK